MGPRVFSVVKIQAIDFGAAQPVGLSRVCFHNPHAGHRMPTAAAAAAGPDVPTHSPESPSSSSSPPPPALGPMTTHPHEKSQTMATSPGQGALQSSPPATWRPSQAPIPWSPARFLSAHGTRTSTAPPLSSPLCGPRHALWPNEEPRHHPPADITAILRVVVRVARAYYFPPIRVEGASTSAQGAGLSCARGDVVGGLYLRLHVSLPLIVGVCLLLLVARPIALRLALPHLFVPLQDARPSAIPLLLWPCHGRSALGLEYFRETIHIRRRPSPRHRAQICSRIQRVPSMTQGITAGGAAVAHLARLAHICGEGVMTRMGS
jgi:hypothetical protein